MNTLPRLKTRNHKSLVERFMEKIIIEPSGCWRWTGTMTKGYGVFFVDGKQVKAHRVSWMLFRGPIPDGHFICHNCPGGDNPLCVNPDHLFPGTPLDNHDDMKRKGRGPIGQKQGRAKLHDSDIPLIRQLLQSGERHSVIAARFGVARSTITNICDGRTWRAFK